MYHGLKFDLKPKVAQGERVAFKVQRQLGSMEKRCVGTRIL